MKKLLIKTLMVLGILIVLPINIVKAEEIGNPAFDDVNFYKCVVDAYNKKNNTQKTIQDNLTDEELQTITSLDCSGVSKQISEKIVSTKGLEKLTLLERLYLSSNRMSELDVSKNVHLKTINDTNTNTDNDIKLKTVKGLENLLDLEELNLGSNQLTEINVSKNTKLTSLALPHNNLSSVDVSNNTKLIELNISTNDLEEIDLSKNTELEKLNLEFNDLKKLDVTNNKKLKTLLLFANDLEEIDVSQNIMLEQLVGASTMKYIDLSNNIALTLLTLSLTDIQKIDLRSNVNLIGLSLNGNELSEIEFPQNNKIEFLALSSKKLNNFSVDKFPNLKVLILNSNLLSLDLKNFNNFQRSGSIPYLVANWGSAVSFNYSFSPQTRTFNLIKENSIYKLNLKEYDNNLDPSKVVFTPIDGVTYDNKTGIFTFTKEVKKISYIYKTGLPSSTGVSEDMEVNLTLSYPNEEPSKEDPKQNEYVDQKAENVQTGAITVGVIGVVGMLIGLTYYIIVKRKNKLFKL